MASLPDKELIMNKLSCYFFKSNIPVINLTVILEIWSDFQKILVWKKIDKGRDSFSSNTDNFVAFFIVFEWDRILESAIDQ